MVISEGRKEGEDAIRLRQAVADEGKTRAKYGEGEKTEEGRKDEKGGKGKAKKRCSGKIEKEFERERERRKKDRSHFGVP